MKSQYGQATVEFAFIIVLFMLIVLGMIYGGLLFMNYLQYNNDARAIAREVAFSKTFDKDALNEKYFSDKSENLYKPYIKEITKSADNTEVKITIEVTRVGNLNLFKMIPSIPSDTEFPPKKLKDIVYTMPIETVAQN